VNAQMTHEKDCMKTLVRVFKEEKQTHDCHFVFRKKWLDFHQAKKITDTNQEDDIHPLIMTSACLNHERDLLNIHIINPFLSCIRITYLDVDCSRVPIITVIELMYVVHLTSFH